MPQEDTITGRNR